MKKPKIVMTILKEDTGYSTTGKVGDIFISTQGELLMNLKR